MERLVILIVNVTAAKTEALRLIEYKKKQGD